jgi:transposase
MTAEEEIAQLKKELAAERAKTASLEGELARERAENAHLRQMLEEVLRRLGEVERQLAKDSHNSSKPPSSDGLGHKRASLRKRSEKKPGGQAGHPGHTLVAVERPDEVVRHHPVACQHCQHCQQRLDEVAGKVKERRQVHDLPEMGLVVCEHQVEEVLCPACGQQNVGRFPGEVTAPVQYGPNVQALAVYLHQGQLVPMARTCLRPRRGVRLSLVARNPAPLGAGGIEATGRHGGADCHLAERGTFAARR